MGSGFGFANRSSKSTAAPSKFVRALVLGTEQHFRWSCRSRPSTYRHSQEQFMAYKTIDGITSSIIPFYLQDGALFVLLGQRGRKSQAFANSWALVGGFLDPGNESLEQ